MIDLQCEKIDDKQICDELHKTVDRIDSMALVHNQLYKSKDFLKVDVNKYINNIAENLFVSHGVDTVKISLKIGKNDIALSLDSAISYGLIIYELITNSLLRETLWSIFSEIHSTLDFEYVNYTSKNLSRFENAYEAFRQMC